MIRTWDEIYEEPNSRPRALPMAPKITWEEEIARLTDSDPGGPPARVICAWCPDFTADMKHASHGMCAVCATKLAEEIDRIDSAKKHQDP